jgi:uncharacterized protein (TIGR00255 family)
MITGMTGFGAAEISTADVKGTIEVKTVNHRYFDISYYFPIGFGSIEEKVRRIINQDVKRGRVTVSLKIVHRSAQTGALNHGAVKRYLEVAKILEKNYGLKDQITVSDLLRLPGVINVQDSVLNPEELWIQIEKSLNKAMKGFLLMRRREGKILAVDISDKLRLMSSEIVKIRQRAKVILQDKKKIMTNEEFSSYQKSNDINEELTRLSHYIDEAKVLLKSGELAGKKFDFVAQEMQRETNTIGSKVQDQTVSNAVIALKSKIEKIREQSQNVE